MSTSVHLPKTLLAALDRRARELGLSRNRLIVQALERDLASSDTWTPNFFAQLESSEPGDERAVDEMLGAIRARRTRKGPPTL